MLCSCSRQLARSSLSASLSSPSLSCSVSSSIRSCSSWLRCSLRIVRMCLCSSCTTSTVCPAAAQLEAVRVLQEEPEHNRRLWENTEYFKKEMGSMGFNTGFTEAPIVPVMTGPSDLAVKLSEGLWNEGIYALPIVFPMVARDAARIRNMMNAGHTKEDLDEAIAAYEKVGKHLGII